MCTCCKSIFKLVMNNQSIILIILRHAQTCAYISSHSFMFFLKELNQCQILKRDNKLQKPSHIPIFDQEKGKATYIENVWCLKSQRLVHQIEISKISSIDLKKRYKDHSDQMICIVKEPNEKLLSYVIKFCGRSYMHISIIEIDHLTQYQLCMT